MAAETAFFDSAPFRSEREQSSDRAADLLLREVIDTDAITAADVGNTALTEIAEPGWTLTLDGEMKEDANGTWLMQTGNEGGPQLLEQ